MHIKALGHTETATSAADIMGICTCLVCMRHGDAAMHGIVPALLPRLARLHVPVAVAAAWCLGA